MMIARKMKFCNEVKWIRLINTESRKVVLRPSKSIRKDFIDYFTSKLNHDFVRSSPVVPYNDSRIPFVNAGMNQFKGILLDTESAPYQRVANSQKCIRISGKHSDLDIVGNDSYHHTFFEMLGNWSFGDYFKKEACEYSWNLLTQVYEIDPNCLYFTYFGGDKQLNLDADEECREIWLNLGAKPDRILPFGIIDNFWEMGPTGPCGPCTEIHIDHRMQTENQAEKVNKGYSGLTELWNIVFIQFKRLSNGLIEPLNRHHIDTGMGLERLATILQQKESNYDNDLFRPIIESIEKYTNAPKYQGKFGSADESKLDTSYRILADHARMITVALSDGVLPDNNPKIKRIIRKAIDITENNFKSECLLEELTNIVAESLGDIYIEIPKNLTKVKHIISHEKELMRAAQSSTRKKWKKLVSHNPKLIEFSNAAIYPGLPPAYLELKAFKESGNTAISGNLAYKLYDTYGLDVNVMEKLANIESLSFQAEDFYNTMKIFKSDSRTHLFGVSDECVTQDIMNIFDTVSMQKTDDFLKYKYVYENNKYSFPKIDNATLLAVIANGNLFYEKRATANNETDVVSSSVIDSNSVIGLILDKTVAYSKAGGQNSDKGCILVNGLEFKFNKVKTIKDFVIHIGQFTNINEINVKDDLEIGSNCSVSIDPEYRTGLMRHHTSAHLLNAALRKILPFVGQKASEVFHDSFILDFNTFGKKLSLDDIALIENTVNSCIKSDKPVKTQMYSLLDALNRDDIIMIPGKTYPNTGIRVLEIDSDALKSKEACCGTHVHKTGVLECFCITNVKSLGASSLSLRATVGPAALSIKKSGEILKNQVSRLDNDFRMGNAPLDQLNLQLANEKKILLKKLKDFKYPYVDAQNCLQQLEPLAKEIKISLRRRASN